MKCIEKIPFLVIHKYVEVHVQDFLLKTRSDAKQFNENYIFPILGNTLRVWELWLLIFPIYCGLHKSRCHYCSLSLSRINDVHYSFCRKILPRWTKAPQAELRRIQICIYSKTKNYAKQKITGPKTIWNQKYSTEV